jgi:hypothetical protein
MSEANKILCKCCGQPIIVKKYGLSLVVDCNVDGNIFKFFFDRSKKCSQFQYCKIHQFNPPVCYHCPLQDDDVRNVKKMLINKISILVRSIIEKNKRCFMFSNITLSLQDIREIGEMLSIEPIIYISKNKIPKEEVDLLEGLICFYGLEMKSLVYFRFFKILLSISIIFLFGIIFGINFGYFLSCVF